MPGWLQLCLVVRMNSLYCKFSCDLFQQCRTTNLKEVDALELLQYLFALLLQYNILATSIFPISTVYLSFMFSTGVFGQDFKILRNWFYQKSKQIRQWRHFGFCDVTRVALSTKLRGGPFEVWGGVWFVTGTNFFNP